MNILFINPHFKIYLDVKKIKFYSERPLLSCSHRFFYRVSVNRYFLKKTRLPHFGNVEKPLHPQFFAQRAPEG